MTVSEAAFRVVDRVGDPLELVSPSETAGERLAQFVLPTRRALVLGSSQDDAEIDDDALSARGIGLARRKSGGGAVLVGPQLQVWLEIFVPVDDPLYEHDIVRGAWWVGELWQEAIVEVTSGAQSGVVHRGGLVQTPYSKSICFLGTGPGEVHIDGKKVVGLSQRRDRRGSWLFSMAMSRREDALLVSCLRNDDATRAAMEHELARAVSTLEDLGVDEVELISALRRRLVC